MIRLCEHTLEPADILRKVASDHAGGTDLFVGTVRDQTAGRKVLRLDFEAYPGMALKEMQKIEDRCREKWPVTEMAIWHRTGSLQVGEVVVLIAVSSPHRAAAFEACRYAIDTLKKTVPIWKKEIFEDGEVWVSAFP